MVGGTATVDGGVVGGSDGLTDVGTVVVVVVVVDVGAEPLTVATEGGVANPGRGAPAISPAPVADSGVARGTPAAGGCLGMGGILNS